MTLDTRLRGYLEEQIDVFIKDPMLFIEIAERKHFKNSLDFILGYFYGRINGDSAAFSVIFHIPEDGRKPEEVAGLIDRRAHEITDAIQREFEKKGIGGNSI